MAIKNHLKNPSMIVAIGAFVVACSGTSYAVSSLPKNSVGATQIKTGAVRSSEVKDGSLLAKDFASGVLLKGDKGDKGDTGAAGPQGAKGTFGSITIQRVDFPLPDGGSVSAANVGNVACPAGQVGVSGGANLANTTHNDARITGSGPRKGTVDAPVVPENGEAFSVWRATAVNPAGGDGETTFRVYIVCATQ
jgi:hypothetical protein